MELLDFLLLLLWRKGRIAAHGLNLAVRVSSICLRCCIADCETPACCQQGCLWVGVVPRRETGDVAVCATSGYVPSKVNNIAAQPNHFILVMETSLSCHGDLPVRETQSQEKVAGKDAAGSRIGGAERHCELP